MFICSTDSVPVCSGLLWKLSNGKRLLEKTFTNRERPKLPSRRWAAFYTFETFRYWKTHLFEVNLSNILSFGPICQPSNLLVVLNYGCRTFKKKSIDPNDNDVTNVRYILLNSLKNQLICPVKIFTKFYINKPIVKRKGPLLKVDRFCFQFGMVSLQFRWDLKARLEIFEFAFFCHDISGGSAQQTVKRETELFNRTTF